MNHTSLEKPTIAEKDVVPDSSSIFFPIHHVDSVTSLTGTISTDENTEISNYSELSINNISQSQNNTSVEEDKAFILCSPVDVFGPLGEECGNEAFLQPRMEKWNGNPYLCDLLPISSENSESEARRATATNFVSASNIPSMENSRFYASDENTPTNDKAFVTISKVEVGEGVISSTSAFEARIHPNRISDQVKKKERGGPIGTFQEGSKNNNFESRIDRDSISNEERNYFLSSSSSPSFAYSTPKASPTKASDKFFHTHTYRYDQLSPPVISGKMPC